MLLNNIEKITTFKELIYRISKIYKNINFEYFKKFINIETLKDCEKKLYENDNINIIKISNFNFMNTELNKSITNLLHLNNIFCKYENILVNQALNYIYVKTNYKFINIIL